MKGTIKKKTRNKYAVRRRIALFSMLVCILGIFLVTNKKENSIFGIAGKGNSYAAYDTIDLITVEKEYNVDVTISYEYILDTANSCINSCVVTLTAGGDGEEFYGTNFGSDWEIVEESSARPGNARIVSKTYTTNEIETIDLQVTSVQLTINVNRIGNHIIRLSNATLWDAVIVAIEEKYGADVIVGVDEDRYVVNGYMLEIADEDLQRITVLDLSGKNVEDVTGISDFTNLQYLKVGNNFIEKETVETITITYNYTVNAEGRTDNCKVQAVGSAAADTYAAIFEQLNPGYTTGVSFEQNQEITFKIPEDGEGNYYDYTAKVKWIQEDYFDETYNTDDGDTVRYCYYIKDGYIAECRVYVSAGGVMIGTNPPEGWTSGSYYSAHKDYTNNQTETVTFSTHEGEITLDINVDKLETVATYDVSANGDGSVIAYIVPREGETDRYDMHIKKSLSASSGRVKDYLSGYEMPYRSEIEKIVNLYISEGVENIGAYMFYECANLTEISIPNSVTEIATYAFSHCSNLKEIELHDNIEKIGADAFQYCQALESVKIPNGLSKISEYLFLGCTKLVNVDLPESIEVIESGAFKMCSELQNISIPQNVTKIGKFAFWECEKISEITIPNTVTTLEEQVFAGWTADQTIYCNFFESEVPAGWDEYWYTNSNANIVWLTENEDYYDDSSVVPTDQKYFTFEVNEDNGTATITGIRDEYAEKSYYQYKEVAYEHYIKCVINDNGTYITDVVIPYEYIDENNNKYIVTSIGDNAFGPWEEDGTASTWSGDFVGGNFGQYEIKENMFTSFTLPNTITSIGDYAFAGNRSVKKINVPGNVTSIGDTAFGGWYASTTHPQLGWQFIYLDFFSEQSTWDENWDQYCRAGMIWLSDDKITISIDAQPTKLEYLKGEELDLAGLSIIVTDTSIGDTERIVFGENGQVTVVTGDQSGTFDSPEAVGITISGYDKTEIGTQTITVTYKEKTATFTVTVKELERIELDTENVEKSYNYGDALDLEGLIVNAIYTDGTNETKEVVSESDYTVEPAQGTELEPVGTEAGTKELTQTITVTYKEKTATFDVEVINELTGITIKSAPTKTEYKKGDTLDLRGLIIEATYNAGTETAEVDKDNNVSFSAGFIDPNIGMAPGGTDALSILGRAGVEISGFDNAKIGPQTITVTYKEKTATFTVTVKELARIELDTENVEKSYNYGDALDLEGLVVNAIYTDGTNETREIVSEGDYTVEPAQGTELEPVGTEAGTKELTQTITVTHQGKTDTFDVKVTNNVEKIEINTAPSKKNYIKGEALELTDGTITVTYQDGTTITEVKMTANKVTVEGFDSSKVGDQTITVLYDDQTGTTKGQFTVNVTDKVTGIEITSIPTKTDFIEGEELDLTGGKITATYDNGATREMDIVSSMISGYNKNQPGKQTITVTYEGCTATFDVLVKYNSSLPSEVESLEISGDYKKDYTIGDKLNPAGMILNVVYIDGTTGKIEILEGGKCKVTTGEETREYDNYEDAGVNIYITELTSVGTQEILISYKRKTGKIQVNVGEKQEGEGDGETGEGDDGEDEGKKEITGAELIDVPENTEYTEGEKLDLSGMKVEITYGDNSIETIEFKKDGKVAITSDGKTTEYDNAEEAGITIKPSNLTVGEHKLEITYKGKEIELPVTIMVNQKVVEVTGITLDKTEETLEVGTTVSLIATITPTDATDKNVTWSSSDEEVATVSASGVVTAKKAGTATITVTSDANPNVKATCNVTVNEKEPPVEPDQPKVSVTGISLNKSETTLKVGQMEDLVCTIAPENATNKNVTWTSSDEEKVIVDENGTILALVEGQVTITVTSEDGEYTATCIVNVEGEKQETIVEVTGVTLDKTEATIKVGETETLVSTILPENATNKKLTWSSSDESVATVTGGVVTAHKAGTATITVTTEDGKKTATCEVTVEAVEVKDETIAVTGVALNKSKTTVKVGNTETLRATITPENATNQNITWSSSDETIVSVKGGVITAHKEGKATITVTTEDGKKTATCEVTVEKVQAPSDNNDNDDKDNNNSNNDNTNTNTSNNNNSSNNQSTGNSTNTQKQDTSPVQLPAAGKGMLAAVIVLITVGGVFSFIKYRNIDK